MWHVFLKREQDIHVLDHFSIQSSCYNSYTLEIDSDFMVSIYLNSPSEYDIVSVSEMLMLFEFQR